MSAREANSQEAVILLIENDESDAFIFRLALAKMEYPCSVFAVETLTQARSYLDNTGRYSDPRYHRRPDLIVSDFNLTGETALDFMKWLRTQPALASLPLVILSGVSTKPERAVFHGFEIKAFLAKTHDVTQLGAMLRPLLP